MPSTEGRATKRQRVHGGEHQRHRQRLATVLNTPNARGIFMSCARGKERKAALDLVGVMDEHCHAWYGDAASADVVDDMDALRNGPASSAPAAPPSGDIEAQIQGELAALRTPRARTKHLVALETDTECLCFIQCTPPVDANRLVRKVLEDVASTGESRSRYVQRVAPVDILCRAEMDAVRTAATQVLPRYFPTTEPRTVGRRTYPVSH